MEAAINLRQLRYFVKVVELGNMTKAASYLNVAQPALGLQIRQLEDTLGSSLLTRHSRGVEPTAAGQKLFERAQQILALVDATRAEMLALRGVNTETVRLGIPPSIMRIIGYEMVVAACSEIPNVTLNITDEPCFLLLETLKRNELDFGLLFETDDSPQLITEPVYEEELLFVTSVANAEASPLTFAEAVRQPLVLPSRRDFLRNLIDRVAEQRGLKLNLAFEVNSPAVIRMIVLREAASTILPLGYVAEDIHMGRLIARRITDPVPRRTLSLVRPAHGRAFCQHTAVDAFLRRMLELLAERSGALMRQVKGCKKAPTVPIADE